jgi:peptidoglycan/xylan/chitin deacetylase (PgdA/CDA1 family)
MSAPLVLCYHAVSDDWTSPLAVAPAQLERQLRFWLRLGYRPQTFSEVVNAKRARTLAVTFDDAFESVLECALPILRKLDVPGTVFVPTAFADAEGMLEWDGIGRWRGTAHERELRCLTWPQLRTLADCGWEIGSHTVTHPHLTSLDDEALDVELRDSRAACEEALGHAPVSLAYPYGDVDRRVIDRAAAAGYRACAALPARPHAATPMCWPRVGVYRRDGVGRLAAKRLVARAAKPPAPPTRAAPARRLAVYTDQAYRVDGDGGVSSPRAFGVFLARLAREFDELALLGRLEAGTEAAPHRVSPPARFVALPAYRGRTRPLAVLRVTAGSLRRYWRALDDVDCVWLLGPSVFGLPFAALAAVRRRQVVLGVRQDLPAYVRARHPGRRGVLLAACALEASWRLLARRCATVVVGEQLARHYRRAARLAAVSISLVEAGDVVDLDAALERDWSGPIQLLAVTRLDPEKNPLLLADILARLPDRFSLTVCGDGPLRETFEARLRELGVERRCELRGYLGWDEGLRDLYREAHSLLHVSLTEGEPQVLHEAFAAGLPTVATAVGGVSDATDGAALLVGPDDAEAAAAAVQRLAREPWLRDRLIRHSLSRAQGSTIERSADRVARFIGARPARAVGTSSALATAAAPGS